ncbi:MAG: hypothetical protein RMM07_11950 [Anaerolineae bacterium]|nr:hypothetical protein [Anaerolineae bacterium]
MTKGDVLLPLMIAGFALLGALITLGNVRQTRAIREVGEVLHKWVIRHIQLTRATAASAIRVEDPTAWLQEAHGLASAADGASFRELVPERHGPGRILFRRDGGWVLLSRRRWTRPPSPGAPAWPRR